MPEIKVKHVVSFSSEDKVHKAENLIKPETYRKWKCATPGEKNATIVLQFEKATRIHSIDIGNESSAFVEVLVGRSSDTQNDYQVLLVASSFMSPLESRNGTHANRVRMFGPEKLSKTTKDEKWDRVQIVCTQPFNKTITYGLTFIKFHSPSEKTEEQPKDSESKKATEKLGTFKLKTSDDDDDEELPFVGSWFGKQKMQKSESSKSAVDKTAPSYATAILASNSNSPKLLSQNNGSKRKNDASEAPPAKKTSTSVLNKEHIVYKDVLQDIPESKKLLNASGDLKTDATSPKAAENRKTSATKLPNKILPSDKPSTSTKPEKIEKKVNFGKIMGKVVFVLSGFVNPLRSELREKALEMGAKYKTDWDSSCTHLICAFMSTPKYEQVKKLNGRIATKEWILDCYKKRKQLSWRDYMLGRLVNDDSDESEYVAEESESDEEFEESEEEYEEKKRKPQTIFQRRRNTNSNSPNKKQQPSTSKDSSDVLNAVSSTPNSKANSSTPSSKAISSTPGTKNSSTSSTQSKKDWSYIFSDSETEDEDALKDYAADTDVPNDSGGDTEDEIQKVENKMKEKNEKSPSPKMNGSKEDIRMTEKPNVKDLPLPELPNLFKKKHFFLYGEFSAEKYHELERYITAYNGVLENYMSDTVKYVITEEKWDQNFDDALSANEDLIFVKPIWISKCHEAVKLVPYQPYIVIPDS